MASKGQRVGYIRVSTMEQNTERQLHGVELDKIFEDRCSGKDVHRPQLQACLEYVRDGDCLTVWELSRLSRSLTDLRSIVDTLISRGVTVEFIRERLTFQPSSKATPMDKLMLNLMGSFAEFEREIIRERQREGIAIARAKGVYSKERAKKLKPEQLAEIREAIAKGVSQRQLARQYQVSRQTLYNHLRTTATH